MWDDDEDQKRPFKVSPLVVGPSVLWWLFVQSSLRVLLPSLTFMGLGIWIGNKVHHKQAWATMGTLVGLGIAAVLIWQQARSQRQPK